MSCLDENSDCKYCPHPCIKCQELCFDGKCYYCFPERIIECKFCGENTWDGICDCRFCDYCGDIHNGKCIKLCDDCGYTCNKCKC